MSGLMKWTVVRLTYKPLVATRVAAVFQKQKLS